VTTYLLAGGGTAGHVNPLLATADELRRQQPDATIIVVGTREGLESRLVPQRGYELEAIPRLPFPRRPNRQALAFFPGLRRTIARLTELIERRGVDVVIGFGGYAAAPAYLAARRAKVPVVIHEANARPGLANRLGARFTPHVGVVFPGTPLRHARVVGLPLRTEIASLDVAASREEGLNSFGLRDGVPTLLVTGGSLGAQRLNHTIRDSAAEIVAAGYQILHIWGNKDDFADPGLPGYRMLRYSDRMDLAFAVADCAVSRAGAATVSELSVIGIPSVLIPYPVGNGEQRVNAADLVRAGGAVLVDDADFTPRYVRESLIPLLGDRVRLDRMRENAKGVGIADGAERLVSLIGEATARA
jgi:UDP-N-acetylglucosamine--N-acetylmuramyl-(pentapeptide) pyrophosphoryl-undecaprenol N-acetylglucosamine transferase